jgi:hypothetical protein
METERRCPVCGRGVLRDLGTEDPGLMQVPESRPLESYTCGHEVAGPPLASTSRSDDLEVERREAPDTVEPA